MGEQLVDVAVVVKDETDKAWKIESVVTGKTAWAPKAVAEITPERFGQRELTLPWEIAKKLVGGTQ